jgi:hypothetical protein
MGDDEYHPLEQSGSNLTEAGGIGYMIVDVIDSLQIMGLDDEYSRARTWVSEKLSFERDDDFSTFEVCLSCKKSVTYIRFHFVHARRLSESSAAFCLRTIFLEKTLCISRRR